MAKRSWTLSLIASAAAIAIAATATVMAVTADKAVGNVRDRHETETAKQIWTVAEPLIATPARVLSLEESAPAGGHWYDHFSVSTTVDGQAGELMIGRDFGPSEDLDFDTLLATVQPTVQSVTVGFKPATAEAQWHWLRFSPDGQVLRTQDGRPFAASFAGIADGQCIAQAWMGVIQSG